MSFYLVPPAESSSGMFVLLETFMACFTQLLNDVMSKECLDKDLGPLPGPRYIYIVLQRCVLIFIVNLLVL